MNRTLVFVLGFIAGILATFLFVYLKYAANRPNDGMLGLREFSEKGECIPTKGRLEIFQVMEPNVALAKAGEFPDETMVLLINHDGKSYYDKQKITIPSKKCARQIGTYQYTTRMGIDKTVPAVVIE